MCAKAILVIMELRVRRFADNGGEFTGLMVDLWAYHHKVRIEFSRPGRLTDNAFIESFNGSLRDECLNVQRALHRKPIRGQEADQAQHALTLDPDHSAGVYHTTTSQALLDKSSRSFEIIRTYKRMNIFKECQTSFG